MFIVEVDTDGVLSMTHKALEPLLQGIYPGFTEEKDITSWGMQSLKLRNPKARERIFELFNDVNFIANLPRYSGVVEGLQLLYEYTKSKGGKIIIHTHMYTNEVAEARKCWLQKLLREAKVEAELAICVGDTKDVIKSDVIIEDNIDNLVNSGADIKFLVRRSHNAKYNVEDMGFCLKGFVVDSFFDAVKILTAKRVKK